MWKDQQSKLLADTMKRGASLRVGGDGRADSPGHSAKFGSYSMVDFETHKVLDIQLVQVRIAWILYYLTVTVVLCTLYVRILYTL